MTSIVYEDLSGSTTPIPEGGNPYQALILASNDDSVRKSNCTVINIELGN
jgi:hypothetical protein